MTSAVPHYRHTFSEYLLIEEMSREVKHEFLDGEIFAMAGGSVEHSALCAALIVAIGNITAGTTCRPHTSDLRIRVRATGLATYADAAIVCGAAERDPESPTHCTNPSVIFEVLSPGSEKYDRGAKREHYQRIESLREYVILAQDRVHAEKWTRDAAGKWQHEMIGAEGTIAIESVRGRIVLVDLYRSAGL